MAVEPLIDESPDDAYDREAHEWLANVYQGDRVRQLSVRSIIAGMLIGGVMSISNLYVGLKTGWGLGVTITSCIIAFAVFRALEAVSARVRRNPFTILENYTMSSCTSAAGYMASSGLVSSIPALTMATGRQLLWWEMMLWLCAISMLGVFMAIPLKRQLINIDKLPFPEGLATAETLKSIHSAGVAALRKAYALFAGGLIGATVAFLQKGVKVLPEQVPFLPTNGGRALMDKTSFGMDTSVVLIGAGAIMGIRVGVSLLLGAIVFYGVIGSELVDRGITKPGYGGEGITKWVLWPASAMMVTSGLLAFALRWRTVIRSFAGLGAIFKVKQSDDPLDHVEVPMAWFVIGTLTAGTACVVLGHYLFDIRWWMGVLAVLLTFVLSIVAARATGETSITPISAMGKITQMIYAVVAPSNMTTNLMTASLTAGASSHAADLLTDLKAGYMLGGNPRYQTVSQLFGVIAGTLFAVPAYYLLVPDPAKLGEAFPAPSAKVWYSVAKLLNDGLQALPPGATVATAVGGLAGIVLTLIEEFAPQKYHKFIPSPIAMGVAGIIPAGNSFSMFFGALLAWLTARGKPALAEAYTIPISSGLIAGESLMGVSIILYETARGFLELWN